MDFLQNIDEVQCCKEIDKYAEALSSQEMLKTQSLLNTEICSFSTEGFEEGANPVRSILSKLTSIS